MSLSSTVKTIHDVYRDEPQKHLLVAILLTSPDLSTYLIESWRTDMICPVTVLMSVPAWGFWRTARFYTARAPWMLWFVFASPRRSIWWTCLGISMSMRWSLDGLGRRYGMWRPWDAELTIMDIPQWFKHMFHVILLIQSLYYLCNDSSSHTSSLFGGSL